MPNVLSWMKRSISFSSVLILKTPNFLVWTKVARLVRLTTSSITNMPRVFNSIGFGGIWTSTSKRSLGPDGCQSITISTVCSAPALVVTLCSKEGYCPLLVIYLFRSLCGLCSLETALLVELQTSLPGSVYAFPESSRTGRKVLFWQVIYFHWCMNFSWVKLQY